MLSVKTFGIGGLTGNVREDDYKAGLPTEDKMEETPEMVLMEADQRQQLMDLMGSLKAKCKEVLSMWSQKYSMKEIAASLGYSNDQVVRNKKNACLKELKEKVRNQDEVRNLVQELVR